MDSSKAVHAFPADFLHATAAPAAEHALPVEPAVLLRTLHAHDMPQFLHDFQFEGDEQVDLRRKKPNSRVWERVITGELSVDDLEDEEVVQLGYLAPGKTAACEPHSSSAMMPASCPRAGAATEPGGGGGSSSGSSSGGSSGVGPPKPASFAVVASLRQALKRSAVGGWTAKYVCAHAPKCGCPFMLEFKHLGNGRVEVWRTAGHALHDPGSTADRAQLRMHPDVEQHARILLTSGLKPGKVAQVLSMASICGSGGGGRGSSQLAAGQSSSSAHLAAAASNARISITPAQVYALRQQMQRQQGYLLTSDHVAVQQQMARLQEAGCVQLYQPYKQGGAASGGQDLIIVVQTPFQKRMLNEFGGRLVFLDGTGGTNKYGYMLYTVVVSAHAAPCRAARPPPTPAHLARAGARRHWPRRASGLLDLQLRQGGGVGDILEGARQGGEQQLLPPCCRPRRARAAPARSQLCTLCRRHARPAAASSPSGSS